VSTEKQKKISDDAKNSAVASVGNTCKYPHNYIRASVLTDGRTACFIVQLLLKD